MRSGSKKFRFLGSRVASSVGSRAAKNVEKKPQRLTQRVGPFMAADEKTGRKTGAPPRSEAPRALRGTGAAS